jgi:RHS repeat-associated protein
LHTTYVLYDKFERQIATYDATKHRTSASQYDAVDRVVSATDTFGQATNYTYSDTLRKKITVDALGLTTTETTDTAGNRIEVIDSLHPATRYQYDKRNRQTKIIDANGGTTVYTFYADGQTASVTDAVGNLTEYFYDIAGRLKEEKSPLGSRFYQYDLVNNRTQGQDRNGRKTDYAYDNLNRVKSETWVGDGKTFTYTYDKNSNQTSADDGNIRYEYSYDYTDLLETVDRKQTGKPTVSFEYLYDHVGNLTQAKELLDSITQSTTIYEYADPRYLNTKISQTGTGLASKQVKFTYDATGLNKKVERYVDGLLKVTTTNAFDVYGRLTGIEQKNGSGTVIANDTYVLDDLNRLEAQTKDGQARAIVYDNTDQVQTVTGSNSEGYTYDLNGNRTGGGYVTGSGNRLMSDGVYNYEYDAEGNRTKRTKIADLTVDEYRWDYRNRLTAIVSKDAGGGVIKTVGYEYDVDDQRVQKTVISATPSVGDGVENYYIDRDQIAFVTDGGGMQTFHYLYGLNVDAVMAQDSPVGMVWALADRLGSVDTLTDKDGNVVDKRSFDSFGRILSETNPSVQFRYGYTGRELDLESGLDYYRARYYDPQVGRFISVDPMGFEAGDTNLYRYVGNNSTNATDPTGMISWNDVVQGATNFRNTVTSNAQTGLEYWAGVAVAGQNEGGFWGGAKQVVGTGFGLLSSLATEDNIDRTNETLTLALGIGKLAASPAVTNFASSFLTKKILTSVGVGIASDLIFPGLLQAPIGKNDKATLPEGYELQKAAFEFSLGFGLDKGAKLAQGLDDLITAGGRKLGQLFDGVPVLVDGFENFARNPTSLGDLFQPGIQSASAAINNAGSQFQHYFASNASGGVGGSSGNISRIPARKLEVFRATDRGQEKRTFDQTGYLLSDAAQNRFVENGGDLADALAHARQVHQKWLKIFGDEDTFARMHSARGSTEFPSEFGLDRTLISVSADRSTVDTFGNTYFQGILPKSLLIPQTLPDAGESEYLIRYGTNSLKKVR